MANTNTYHLMILRPSPSMSQDKKVFTAASYLDAVEVARAEWRKVRRSVTLHTGEYDMYFWHRISADGESVDRNTNSGVPALAKLEAGF